MYRKLLKIMITRILETDDRERLRACWDKQDVTVCILSKGCDKRVINP